MATASFNLTSNAPGALVVLGASVRLRSWHRRRDRSAIQRWPAAQIPPAWLAIEPTAGPRISFAVDLWPADLLVGRITLRDLDDGAARLGMYLHPDHYGRGYGSEALRLLVRSAGGLGLSRLRLDVAIDNRRAIRCYEKCGFEVAGQVQRGDVVLLEMARECGQERSA